MNPNFKNSKLLVAGGFLLAGIIIPSFLLSNTLSNQSGNQVAAITNTDPIKLNEQKPLEQNFNDSAFTRNLTDDMFNLNDQIRSGKLSPLDPRNGRKLVNLAKARKESIKSLIKQNPVSFLFMAIPSNKRSQFPLEVQNEIEKEVTITGKVTVMHIDDFQDHKNSRFEYSIRQNDGAVLKFYPVDNIPLISRTKIKVKGYQLDDVIISPADKKSFSVLEPSPQPDSVGDQKTLVLLVDFQDTPTPPFTKEQAKDIFFNGQIQKFYKEQSYNKVSFSGDVFGWYKLNKKQNDSSACGASNVSDPNMEKIISDNNIDLGNYGRLIFVVNNAGGGCSYIGKSDITIKEKHYLLSVAWVGASNYSDDKSSFNILRGFNFVTGHELGHSLGVMHANGWDCGDQVLYGDCQHLEYGNYFDVMGYGIYSDHFNVFYKELLGWINPSKITNINETGVYHIDRLEEDGNNLAAKVQIRRSVSTTTSYYLEYRDGVGFDNKLNDPQYFVTEGLLVNKIRNDYPFFLYSNPYPQLIDTNPTGQYWGDLKNSALSTSSQNVFDDSGNGLIIGPVIEASSTGILFKAEMKEPYCIIHNPTISELSTYPYNEVSPGGNLDVFISFINMDTYACGGSNFSVTFELPSSWVNKSNDYRQYLYPDEKAWNNFSIDIPKDTLAGKYSIKIKVSNLKTGSQIVKEKIISVTETLAVKEIKPVSGVVDSEIKIIGTGFANYNNQVTFYRPDWSQSGYFYNLPVSVENDLKVIKFKIPSSLNRPQYASTTPGNYKIRIYSGGSFSNESDFEVIQSSSSSSSSISSSSSSSSSESSNSSSSSSSSSSSKTNKPPEISSISGPTNIAVGVKGKWTIKASDPENGRLTYRVKWNVKSSSLTPEQEEPFVQTASFTHIYSKEGIYQPTFIVKDNKGKTAETSMTVKVSASSSSSSSSVAPTPTLTNLTAISSPVDNGSDLVSTSTAVFSFTINNTGETSLYVSRNPSKFVATSTTAVSGRLTSVATDMGYENDTPAYSLIPSGSSRKFTLGGDYGNDGGVSGNVEFKITKIYFGDNPSKLRQFNISRGLGDLRVSDYLNN